MTILWEAVSAGIEWIRDLLCKLLNCGEAGSNKNEANPKGNNNTSNQNRNDSSSSGGNTTNSPITGNDNTQTQMDSHDVRSGDGHSEIHLHNPVFNINNYMKPDSNFLEKNAPGQAVKSAAISPDKLNPAKQSDEAVKSAESDYRQSKIASSESQEDLNAMKDNPKKSNH